MIFVGRIPSKNEDGCPIGTYGCTGKTCYNIETCFCEEHCSWERCRILDAPDDCLTSVNGKWKWNSKKIHWVAQITGMKYQYIYTRFAIRIELGRTVFIRYLFSISYEDIDDGNASGINIESTDDSTARAGAIETAFSQDTYTKSVDAKSFGEWRSPKKGIFL